MAAVADKVRLVAYQTRDAHGPCDIAFGRLGQVYGNKNVNQVDISFREAA
jgi:hypothetical protein